MPEGPSFLASTVQHLLHLDTPVPWLLVFLALTVVSAVRVGWVRRRNGSLIEIEGRLRSEIQSHGETKLSYHGTLVEALRFTLTRGDLGFDEKCRVTVYRKSEGDSDRLKRIFRHSRYLAYQENGRISIPNSEGIVGAAWHNAGKKEFKTEADHGSAEYIAEIDEALRIEGIPRTDVDLSMPTRHFVAHAIQDHDRTERVGVIVYESVDPDKLDAAAIDQLIAQDMLDISRLLKYLAALDGEISPSYRGSLDG